MHSHLSGVGNVLNVTFVSIALKWTAFVRIGVPTSLINPAVDRVTFLETGHRERLTLVGIGAGVNL
jgi:hypothetical protein